MNKETLTVEQAQALVEAHEIEHLFANNEECEMLQEENPDLYEAYKQLLMLAGM